MRSGLDLFRPDFLARLCIKRAEPTVVGRTDENQASRRCDGTPQIRPARVTFALGQILTDAQRGLPCNLARVDVDRRQSPPGRLITGQTLVRFPEPHRPFIRYTVKGFAFLAWDHNVRATQILCVDEEIAKRRVE